MFSPTPWGPPAAQNLCQAPARCATAGTGYFEITDNKNFRKNQEKKPWPEDQELC